MPANPRIPNPQEGPLQEFAYDLRELGEGKASVAWIAGHEETTVSRAALYAALSGERLPKRGTVSTLLRWWAGDPTLEESGVDERYLDPIWVWIDRLPWDHEKRSFAEAWRTRYQRLARDVLAERELTPPAERVAIAVPVEQQRFIEELKGLIERTGLKDDLWLLMGSFSYAVERYLEGTTIPTEETCWRLSHNLAQFIPGADLLNVRNRLVRSAEVARAARVRDRRLAREGRVGRET
ncbi:hypothetical protein [Streptomyces agglomeratus]|uniref:hypothetical protein n=1 Tax=Streptomyces agglomeratus TaxID=285458 RepID=UPI0008544E51|nr:hypothetical protein [Streptomyces agglomeratus]OEJ36302.1 hypothetical protein BGK72_38740 [Streptomyces agglomeratus]